MEFWGIEVKPGETVKCAPGDDKYLHLSQASLGEVKKDSKGGESVPVYVKFNDQKLVIGTLSTDKCPQITYDLVFEKEFELSHNWKNGSVFFVGYKTVVSEEPDDFMEGTDSDSEEENTPVKKEANESMAAVTKLKANILKIESLAAKQSVKAEPPKKVKKEDDADDDSSEDDSDEDESDDGDMLGGGDDSDDEDEDESSEEEEEATPKKPNGKKRPAGSASKTPVPDKKAKLVTPVGSQKTGGGADGKKGGHTATPYPAKQAQKAPATSGKSKQQTPKSAGSVSCKSCTKTFKDDNALKAHTKAKHSGM